MSDDPLLPESALKEAPRRLSDWMPRGWMPVGVVAFILLATMVLGNLALAFYIGIFLAFIFEPMKQRCLAVGLTRTGAAAMTTAFGTLVFVSVLALLFVAIFVFAEDAYNLGLDAYRALLDFGERVLPPGTLAGLDRTGPTFTEGTAELLRDQTSTVLSAAVYISGSLASLGLLILLTPFVFFFLLLDGGRWMAFAARQFTADQRVELYEFWDAARTHLFGYFKGMVIICTVQAALHTAGYLAIGLDNAVLIGLAVGFSTLIPILGNFFMFLVALFLALTQFVTLGPVLAIVGLHAGAQLFEAMWLQPKIMSEHLNVHPLIVLYVVFIGGGLFGILGALLALPLVAISTAFFAPRHSA